MRYGESLSSRLLVVLISLYFFFAGSSARAESIGPVLVTQIIDETKLVTLAGNTRPEANAENDLGLVPDSLALEHMMLQLKRSPERERELLQLIEGLTDRSSPNFHQWLTVEQFGERFGVVDQDRDTIKNWLRSHGFVVNVDYPNDLLIDFSGTAAQVSEAFHSQIHELSVKGVKHFANMNDPQIPAALAPAVVGVVSLHDFSPHPAYQPRPDYTFGCLDSTCYAVVPADLATIYNLNPLLDSRTRPRIRGQGQTIVVIEDSDAYGFRHGRNGDWDAFRSAFGLGTDGTFSQTHPGNCSDPGINAHEQEAILDAEYASASAPGAAIVLASCSTGATFGGLIALENLLNEGTPPPLVSISYSECEAFNGASANTAFNDAYQQGVTEGVSVFVSAGDSGAAGCDPTETRPTAATHGRAVNGLASTPYNVAVGGTDFSDTYHNENSTYWSSTDSAEYGSAKSYIPEIPWNDSCGSLLLAKHYFFNRTYGNDSFCNSEVGIDYFISTVAGSGGQSGCATGTPSEPGVVSGSCAGWAKPSWQSLVGNPSDGVRDLPDVSLFAADGVWDHFYLFCWSDAANGGKSCSGAPSTWSAGGGTSFAAPIMAGIQALVNQKAGERQGNPNPVYYSMAAVEYGATGNARCNSNRGNVVRGACVFYDVTEGDMDVVCTGSINCLLPSAEYGVLSDSRGRYEPDFRAATGWDFATGIGSVNAANLVNDWEFSLSASPGITKVPQGSKAQITITITPVDGFSGNVTLDAPELPRGVSASFSPNPATSTSVLTLRVGIRAATGRMPVTITGTYNGWRTSTTITLAISRGTP
jgi:subtilase family serine protease